MIETLTDKVPPYVHNKHVSYENTVLQEHAGIVMGMKDTAAFEAMLEIQAGLFIGLCIKGESNQFISDRLDKYYDEELKKLSNENRIENENIANSRAWRRIMNEAMDIFINKYKIDGSKAKIAVIDDELYDGKIMVDVDDPRVDYTDDEGGI